MGSKQSTHVQSCEESSALKSCPSDPESDASTSIGDEVQLLRDENEALKAKLLALVAQAAESKERETKCVADWQACIEASRKQATDLAAELETVRSQDSANLDAANALNKSLQQDLDGKAQELSVAKASLEDAAASQSRLKEQVQTKTQAHEDALKELSATKSALEDAASSQSVLKEQLLAKTQSHEDVAKELSVAKATLEDAVASQGLIKEQLQAKTQAHDNVVKDLVAANASLRDAASMRDQFTTESQELSAVKSTLETKVQHLNDQLQSNLKELAVVKSTLEDSVANQGLLKEQLQAKTQAHQDVLKELSVVKSVMEDAASGQEVLKEQLLAKTQAHQEILKELSVAKSVGEDSEILKKQLQAKSEDLVVARAALEEARRGREEVQVETQASFGEIDAIKQQLQAKCQELDESRAAELQAKRLLEEIRSQPQETVSGELEDLKKQLLAKSQELDESREAEREAKRLLEENRSQPQELSQPKTEKQDSAVAGSVEPKADDSMNQLLVEEMDRLQNENRDLKARQKVFDKFRQIKKISWDEIESAAGSDSKVANTSAKTKGATKRSSGNDGSVKKQRTAGA